jgi:hypothetical protein
MQTTDLGINLIAFGQPVRVFGMKMLQNAVAEEDASEIDTSTSIVLAQMIRSNPS